MTMPTSASERVTWSVLYSSLAVLTIVGNSLSIAVFLNNPRLRRMRTSLLLINLAIADLLVGAVAVPIFCILASQAPSDGKMSLLCSCCSLLVSVIATSTTSRFKRAQNHRFYGLLLQHDVCALICTRCDAYHVHRSLVQSAGSST